MEELISGLNNRQDLNVLMVASECRGLAKVGGLGDVVWELSHAISKAGINTKICIPYYSVIDCIPALVGKLDVLFAGKSFNAGIYKYIIDDIEVFLIRSPAFFEGKYADIYIDSDSMGRGPFEDDARRFAFFSAAVISCIDEIEDFSKVNRIHCHDWQTGVLFLLLNFDRRYTQLKNKLSTVFTIHNLDYQGVRPFYIEDDSDQKSFYGWFDELYLAMKKDRRLKLFMDSKIKEPCFNPMRAAINLCDFVTTVSPTYAKEIVKKDNNKKNFIGGRGLEKDLNKRLKDNSLKGILNGLDYSIHQSSKLNIPYDIELNDLHANKKAYKNDFLDNLESKLRSLIKKKGKGVKNKANILSFLKSYNPDEWKKRFLLIAVTRLVKQKMGLLLSEDKNKDTLIEKVLERNISLIILGTGDMEKKLSKIFKFKNALIINAFDSEIAEEIYAVGDIFLMPSDFEPCGISQMISMRYGCLPLAHDIGGLHDTIIHDKTGYLYSGKSVKKKRESFLNMLDHAISNDTIKIEKMKETAMQNRFLWESQAEKYIDIYSIIKNN